MKNFKYVLVGLALLAGCSDDQASNNEYRPAGEPGITTVKVNVDGQMVTCIWAAHRYGGGLSCDWNR